MDGQEFLAFLKERERALTEELAGLQRKRAQLKDMADCLEEALSMSYDMVEFTDMPEERLEIWPTGASLEDTEETAVYRSRRYDEFLRNQEGIPRPPRGEMLSADAARNERFLELSYFQGARLDSPGGSIHLKPAGRYAIMAHKGSFLSHAKALKRMLDHLDASGYAADGEIYAYDMVGYAVENDEECFRTRYCVRAADA